jgi:hypothetical protein
MWSPRSNPPKSWGRPEAYLEREVRGGISHLALMPEAMVRAGTERLAADLRSGAWDARYGFLRSQTHYDAGYRFMVAEAMS